MRTLAAKGLVLLAALATLGHPLAAPASPADLDVIPAPAQVEVHSGSFVIHDGTELSLSSDPRAARIARYFADLLRETRGIRLITKPASAAGPDAIELKIAGRVPTTGPETYSVTITPQHIVLSAAAPRGLLYAAVTLWQLCTTDQQHGDTATVPAATITDSPRFPWRGLMLDSARHYQSPHFILQFIDWMALHKLNVLHWHLTDDQAWRLQIRKYPRLTEAGAWRVPAGAGPAADIDPATHRPRLYGGFYSQDTVKQIVAHAARRNVTIVPEIDMPGHATAAIVAYPRLGTVQPGPSAVPSDWGVYDNLYNAEPGTFEFLEDVLGEVVQLFPGRYIHVGGDEAVKDQWRASPAIQERMRALGVTSEQALQSYFVVRMGKFLVRHGRRLIGWDEILEGGIAQNATIMSWRGIDGAIAAATAGHDAVLSPEPTLYFDGMQGRLPDEPPGRGRFVRLEDVYRFDPMPASLSVAQRTHVLGVQANIWTEHIATDRQVEEMTFPRAAAVAEIGWSPAGKSQWGGFVARLPSEMGRYRALGIEASQDAFAVNVQTALDRPNSQVRISLSNQTSAGEIHYTLDGSEPTAASTIYAASFVTPAKGELRAAAFLSGHRLAPPVTRPIDIAALQTRSSLELKSCTDKLLLYLEDDAPVQGPRALFLVDIMNPCWIYQAADLSRVGSIVASVGQLPFNFQLGAEVNSIKLTPPQTAAGELEVHLDSCEGERIASISLQPALDNQAVTNLPRADIRREGVHDLCFRFTQRSLDPLWVLDRVRLLDST